MNILLFLIIVLVFIVGIGLLNERVFKLQSDIALILFSLIISLGLLFARKFSDIDSLNTFIDQLGDFGFEEYLMDGVLCFMLFAGASKVNMRKFKQNIRPISLLALLTTVISSVFYGVLFYLVSLLFKLPLDLTTCVLLGCVVSPTDPIAATGILNKIGLSKNVCSIIENESLFNDGTGVTLFIFVRGLITKSEGANFFVLFLKEILGAIAVALVMSFIFFSLIKLTRDPIKYILISLLNVSLVYIICEHLGFSGVIASVVCGMYFSYAFSRIENRVVVIDEKDLYRDFWEILESILNAVLFVMIALLVLNIKLSNYVLLLVPVAIIIIVFSRGFGVFISSLLTGRKMPGNYSLSEFVALMTWSALKGGLSLALALGTKEFLPPDVYLIFLNVTYVTIFFTVLVQGLTIKKVYFSLERHKTERLKRENHR